MLTTLAILSLVLTWIKIKSLQDELVYEKSAKDILSDRIDELYAIKELRDKIPSIIYEKDKEYTFFIERDCLTNRWVLGYKDGETLICKEENRYIDNAVTNLYLTMQGLGLIIE